MADNEFARMEIETSRLNDLIGEILDFARLEKSTTELHLSQTNIADLLAQVISDANYEFSHNSIRIQAGIITPCELNIDQRLIHRAIENIVRNASHYSPPDEKVLISSSYNKNKDQVYIDINDKGPGVPEDQLEKIFNPFYRVDTSRTKKPVAMGLGSQLQPGL